MKHADTAQPCSVTGSVATERSASRLLLETPEPATHSRRMNAEVLGDVAQSVTLASIRGRDRAVALRGEELGQRSPQRLPLFAWDVRYPASMRVRLAHELLASEVDAGADFLPRLITQAVCHEAPV